MSTKSMHLYQTLHAYHILHFYRILHVHQTLHVSSSSLHCTGQHMMILTPIMVFVMLSKGCSATQGRFCWSVHGLQSILACTRKL